MKQTAAARRSSARPKNYVAVIILLVYLVCLAGLAFAVISSTWQYQTILYGLVLTLLAIIPLFVLLHRRAIESKQRSINELKTQLVSIASHELRSPLNGILWALEQLLKPKLHPHLTIEELDLLTNMYHSAESSLTTVNEILDFSIFERDKPLNISHEIIDLDPTIRQVMKTLELSAQQRAIHIHFTGKWPAKVEVNGDVTALKRCFVNLLNNSIKYSPPRNDVAIIYEHRDNTHVIGIIDHGIGIPKEDQEKVLQGYFRADNAIRYQNGTGLGLWTTRLIIEQHGGKLWLESEVDKGTTVYLSLPETQPATQTETNAAPLVPDRQSR